MVEITADKFSFSNQGSQMGKIDPVLRSKKLREKAAEYVKAIYGGQPNYARAMVEVENYLWDAREATEGNDELICKALIAALSKYSITQDALQAGEEQG